ncbi:MAG TPA: hypothetical protein VEB40_13130 [Flavipsychrobacter sp.]|nr:hypothetical protein [Flavipsychrobacter sp.]
MKKLLLPVFLLVAITAFGQRGQVRDKIHDDQEKSTANREWRSIMNGCRERC